MRLLYAGCFLLFRERTGHPAGRPRRASPPDDAGRLPGKPEQNAVSTKGDIMAIARAGNGFPPLADKHHILSVHTAVPSKGAAGFFYSTRFYLIPGHIIALTRKIVNFGLTNIVVDGKVDMTNKFVKNIRRLIREIGDEELGLINNLKKYRSELGINQTELGRLAGVSRQTISLIERGDYSPSVTLALKIAKICEVRVEDIFVYEEDEKDDEKHDC